ncbi:MAG: hypothetical protein ACQKBV_01785 [Puniceicoccales bacterium]
MSKVYLAALIVFLSASGLSAEPVAEFLKKARAQLGSESALKGVESLQYAGEVMSPTGEKISELKLVFDKPDRQLLREDRNDEIHQTAVNGFEGYLLSYNKTDPANKVLRVLPPAQTKRLMANAVENLNFFNGPMQLRGAEIVDGGMVDYKGQTVRKVLFKYPLGLVYERYFDPNSGKLLATVSSDGLTMVERKSLQSGGIKFPKVVDTYDAEGNLVRTVEFTEIVVNGTIEPGAFDFPG